MQIQLDTKTLITGIAMGAIITIAIGAGVGSADADRFGIAIPEKGTALVRTDDGGFYIVTAATGMASRVLQYRDLSADSTDPRTSKGVPFNVNTLSQPVKSYKEGG